MRYAAPVPSSKEIHSGAAGSSSAALSNLFTGPAHVWSYAGQVAGPIFTFGAIEGQVRSAEAGKEEALLFY